MQRFGPLAVIFLIVVLTYLVTARAQPAAAPAVGRYQAVYVPADTVGNAFPAIVRLDTATGELQYLTVDSGKHQPALKNQWLKVETLPDPSEMQR